MGRNLALRVGALVSLALSALALPRRSTSRQPLRRRLTRVIALLGVAGCGESATAPLGLPDPEIPPPAYAISDAINAGNPHVYFLPPVVPNPAPTGTFDGSLSPRVEICESDLTACIGEPFAVFTSGDGVDEVRVVPEDEHYILNWDTGAWGLAIDAYYRITVFQASLELGYVDVRVDGKGGGSNPGTGETFSLKDGRTLPLKVRIEEGAAAMAPASASTPDGSATVSAPPGALQQYEELTVEPVDEGTTELPDDGAPLPGSVYDFGPDGLEFDEPVELDLAYDPATLPEGVVESELRVYVAGPDGWELLPGGSVDLAHNRVTGLTTHFSVFAILPGRVKKCQGGGYGTLEEALADVGPEGTITVCDGTHSVEGVVVDKPVTIRAEAGATPVLVTSTEPAALFVDGIASGSVVLDGLTFEYSTPHPAPGGANAYAVQAQNEYDQVVIRNTTFTIDPGSRGAVSAVESSVPSATITLDGVDITGGVFGLATLGPDVVVTNSSVTGTSFIGVSIAGTDGYASGLVQNNTFADCGTRCVRPSTNADVDVISNDFGPCGSQRCVSVGVSSHVDVLNNTFAAPVLTGASAPDQNDIILVTGGSSGMIEGNTFQGCGHFDCVVASGAGSSLTVTSNEFTHVAGQVESEFSDVIAAHDSAVVTAEQNLVHSCGVSCYEAVDGGTVTARNETVTAPAGHGTRWIVDSGADDPTAGASTIVFEDNAVTGSGSEVAMALFHPTAATVNRNTFTDLGDGFEVHNGSTLTGRDNTLGLSGTALSIFEGFADFRFNDITGQSTDIGPAGDGTSNLTCNWWGTVDGPASVSGVPLAVYTPWALAPIAGTAASDCTEVRVASADDGSRLPFFSTVGEAVARVPVDGTVLVSHGTHSVEGVVVDRPVTIQAEAGATPVLETTTEPAALFVDGIASGSVVLDGLTFEYSTQHPLPDGAIAYAVQAANEYEQVVIRNTTFTIDPGSRGAVSGVASSVPGATITLDNVHISGGTFGVAVIGHDVVMTNSSVTGTSFIGISISGSDGPAHGLVANNTFADCGTRCVRPTNGADVDVIANDFGPCGSLRCVSVGGGSIVDVLNNTFAAPVLTGESGADQDNVVLIHQSTGTVDGNVFQGCGFFDCIEAFGVGASATIRNNEFTHVAGQSEWIASDVVLSNRGATVVSEQNTLHSCGVMCYKVLDGSAATIRNETIGAPSGHGTMEIVFAGEDDPASGPNTITFEDNVVTGGATARAFSTGSETALAVNGNSLTGLSDGIVLGGTGSTLTGRDNTLGLSGTALSIFEGFADFRFNDITGQSTDIGPAGDGTSNLTCNWWGTVDGPASVSGVPPAVYTPWALAPIAGTAASGCSGGV